MSEQIDAESGPDRSSPEEKDYLLRRAEQHRHLAERADEAGTKHIHLRLMALYVERADRIVVVDLD